jgi:hypothetical protein
MRSTFFILASSTPFTGATSAFSTSATNIGNNSSSATFFGYSGGPVKIPYAVGIAMQAAIGTNSPTQTNLGGVFNILGSNINESSQFVIQSSAIVASSGGVMIKDNNPWYQWVDFRFIPNTTMGSSAGFLNVYLSVKGNT